MYTTNMPLRSHLPVGDMDQIIGMLLAGQAQRHVGHHFNVSHTVVGRVWQRYLDTGSVAERPRNGRPRKTTLTIVILSALLNVSGLNPQNRLMRTSGTLLEYISVSKL